MEFEDAEPLLEPADVLAGERLRDPEPPRRLREAPGVDDARRRACTPGCPWPTVDIALTMISARRISMTRRCTLGASGGPRPAVHASNADHPDPAARSRGTASRPESVTCSPAASAPRELGRLDDAERAVERLGEPSGRRAAGEELFSRQIRVLRLAASAWLAHAQGNDDSRSRRCRRRPSSDLHPKPRSRRRRRCRRTSCAGSPDGLEDPRRRWPLERCSNCIPTGSTACWAPRVRPRLSRTMRRRADTRALVHMAGRDFKGGAKEAVVEGYLRRM